jgi:lipopolysaccharide biosynthesis regulator YciM
MCPSWHKPWVSYAQMEKRCNTDNNKNDSAKQLKWAECRKVLQRALTQNPNCPRVIQAWGLLELQKGNFWPAVQMLERCVMQDPFLAPVLNWKPVKEAKSVIYGNQN